MIRSYRLSKRKVRAAHIKVGDRIAIAQDPGGFWVPATRLRDSSPAIVVKAGKVGGTVVGTLRAFTVEFNSGAKVDVRAHGISGFHLAEPR